MDIFWLIMVAFGVIFAYCFAIIVSYTIYYNCTEWDYEQCWCLSGCWPITFWFFLSWVLAKKIPNHIIKWAKEKRDVKLKVNKNRYEIINVPKSDIDNLEDYRKLGYVEQKLREKLISYEKSNNVPVTERVV